jgi:hypothetical protein
MTISATGFVDASGDATLTWLAGLPCRESANRQVHGTQMVVLENIVEDKHPERGELTARMTAKAKEYKLKRTSPVSFVIPGRGIAVLNMTHTDTPLEPLAAARSQLEGKAQADIAVDFLKKEYPECFGNSRVRAYGNPGIRQTRWIVGRHQLTLPEIRAGQRPDDAVTRCAWWVELHDTKQETYWEAFADNHVYYIPLGCMVPADADNIVAAGRCVDADSHALSAIRVMGPCIAMGIAAAHALDLAGTGSVAQIDLSALQRRLTANLDQISA